MVWRMVYGVWCMIGYMVYGKGHRAYDMDVYGVSYGVWYGMVWYGMIQYCYWYGIWYVMVSGMVCGVVYGIRYTVYGILYRMWNRE